MKLQVALDRLSYSECFEVISDVHPYADIIEVGTGVIKEYGLGLIRNIKDEYPEATVLADVKICDAGRSESRTAFEYGADIITVMSFADAKTISDCVDNARKYQCEVVVDLLNNHDPHVLETLKKSGAGSVSLHIGKDQQASATRHIDELATAMKDYDFTLFAAGGINKDNLQQYMKYNPDVVIVGSGIVKDNNPAEAARTLQRSMTNEEI